MSQSSQQRPIYAIAGPTASGKTALGVELARRIGGEVVNCDSVQIYKEIKIATAKPTDEEKRGVAHHLIDYVDPRINYSAADWAADATEKITEIESRGNMPILVGGTGFYLRTLRQPLFEGPKTDEYLRNRLQKIKEERGPEHLHKMLTRVDVVSAEQLFPRDYVRVIRALEVFFQTGKPISERQLDRMPPPEFADRIVLLVIEPPRDILYEKINLRTEAHFEMGLVEEVRQLREQGIDDSTNALGSHGYRRVCEYLRGERTLESALEQTKQDVRNYAKRQLTWFRRENDAKWIKGFGADPDVILKMLKYVQKST